MDSIRSLRRNYSFLLWKEWRFQFCSITLYFSVSEKRALKRNTNIDNIEPREPRRMKSLPRLWINPSWDQKIFTKGQVWIGVRMEGSTVLADCFDCKTIPAPESSAPPCGATINGVPSSFGCRSGFQVLSVTTSSLELLYNQIPGMESKATFYASSKVYERIFSKSITCVDVNGELGAAVSVDKGMKVWNIATEEIVCEKNDQGETYVTKLRHRTVVAKVSFPPPAGPFVGNIWKLTF